MAGDRDIRADARADLGNRAVGTERDAIGRADDGIGLFIRREQQARGMVATILARDSLDDRAGGRPALASAVEKPLARRPE